MNFPSEIFREFSLEECEHSLFIARMQQGCSQLFVEFAIELVVAGYPHRSTRQLEEAIRHYLDVNKANPRPFVWSKSADEILASLERFYARV